MNADDPRDNPEPEPAPPRRDPDAAARQRRARDRARAIADCGLCDEHGYRGLSLCHHDPEALARAKRGIELVYHAMGWTRR